MKGVPLGNRTRGRSRQKAAPGLRFTEHMDEEDGPLVFQHACKLGLEGIVSKRRESFYSSGRSPHWIKTKNPDAPAAKREADEDWGRWPSANGDIPAHNHKSHPRPWLPRSACGSGQCHRNGERRLAAVPSVARPSAAALR
jgi:hypothetical protein